MSAPPPPEEPIPCRCHGDDGSDRHHCLWLDLCPLHAAAPDLLEALSEVVGSPAEHDDERVPYVLLQVDRGALRAARAVIARAALKEAAAGQPTNSTEAMQE